MVKLNTTGPSSSSSRYSTLYPLLQNHSKQSIQTYLLHKTKSITIIDGFSKYAPAYYLRDGTTRSITQSLLHFSTYHGLPLTIETENGTEFTNQLFTKFTQLPPQNLTPFPERQWERTRRKVPFHFTTKVINTNT